MRLWILAGACAIAMTGPVAAQDYEIEISFYLQPDGTGSNTENRSIALEDGEIEIEGHNADESVRATPAATPEEIADLTALVAARFASLALTAAPDLDYPYIEVQIEFDGGATAAEIEYLFPPGGVPQDLVALQSRYFSGAFR